jgi:nucleoside-diphosphate-sugar epimerase
MKNKKNILITGGAGFIGSNLLQLFLINKKFKKYKFVIVDNSENFSNVQFSLKNERVVLVKCDFTDSYLLSDIENNVYEHIIHFAAISSVPISIKNH